MKLVPPRLVSKASVGTDAAPRRGTWRMATSSRALRQGGAGHGVRSCVARPAFTLVEMLVVIAIIVGITALAIRITAPDTSGRRLRESARQVGGLFQLAKAKAAETERVWAVIIQPDAADARVAFSLRLGEVPPPYSGDTLTSVAAIKQASKYFPSPASTQRAVVKLFSDVNDVLANGYSAAADTGWLNAVDQNLDLVRAGDFIRFGSQGHYYAITATNRGQGEIEIEAVSTAALIMLPELTPFSYQVIRQPTPAAGNDLELPQGVVIDLVQSGLESTRLYNNGPGSVPTNPPPTTDRPWMILMSPGGQVQGYLAAGNVYSAGAPLYLLIGKSEQVLTEQNLTDFGTYWVAVSNLTGLVSTAENSGVQGVAPNPLNESRDYVRKALSKGGR